MTTHLARHVLQVFSLQPFHSSCGARESVAAHGLHRPTRERPATESPTVEPTQRWCSDCGKGRAKRDGQERADRLTTSLRALGLWNHRSGTQAEKGDFTSHPADSLEKP
jgi:hypothetical protein